MGRAAGARQRGGTQPRCACALPSPSPYRGEQLVPRRERTHPWLRASRLVCAGSLIASSQSQPAAVLRLGQRLENVPGLGDGGSPSPDWLSLLGSTRVGPAMAGREFSFPLAAGPRC